MKEFTIRLIKGHTEWEFTIVANLKTDSDMQAVIDNWTSRTRKYTVQSLIDYINSKSKYGYKAQMK